MGHYWIEAMERRLCLSAGVYDFGQVGNYNVKAVVEGPRNVATFSLVGGGSGQVAVTDSGLDVTLANTTAATTLYITAKGWRPQVHGISDGGSIGRIVAGNVDVTGDVNIGGTIFSLQLGNVLGGHSINIGSGVAGAEVSLGTVTDTMLLSGTPFKTFNVNGWYDTDSIADVITTPWIGTMKVKADFGGDLTTASVGSASIGENWAGATTITGNAGALKMSHLRGDLSVGGKSTGIWTKDYLFVGGQSPSPTGGVLHIAGMTHVKSARESFNAVNTTLYAALTRNMYSAQELLGYDAAGSTRNYNVSASVNRSKVTGTATQAVEANQVAIDSRDCWVVDDTDSATQTSTGSAFFRDGTGTYETQFTSTDNTTGQQLQLDLGMLKFAPPALGVGQTNRSSGHIGGSLHLPPSITGTGSSIDAPVSGVASVSTRLFDHDLITTPAGTFLAVKMQVTRSFDVIAAAHAGLFVFQRKIHITQSETMWAVPGVGVVAEASTMVQQARTLGFGNRFSGQALISKETRELTSYS